MQARSNELNVLQNFWRTVFSKSSFHSKFSTKTKAINFPKHREKLVLKIKAKRIFEGWTSLVALGNGSISIKKNADQ